MRYVSQKAFPPYIFIPGVNPHPKKAGGYREGVLEPTCRPIDLKDPKANEDLLYALDLINHGYYWESHVYFEALWNAHGRVGSVADFFKAMIKLGAAGVKTSIDQDVNAQAHLERAAELLTKVRADEGSNFLGFDLEKIIQDITKTTRPFVTFT